MQSKSMQDARHRKLSLQCWQWLKQHSCLASVAFAYVFIFLRSLGTKLPTTVNVVKSQCTCCRLSPVSDTESSLGESATLSLGSSKPVANVRISSYCHDINIRSPPFLRNHFNTLAWYSLVLYIALWTLAERNLLHGSSLGDGCRGCQSSVPNVFKCI